MGVFLHSDVKRWDGTGRAFVLCVYRKNSDYVAPCVLKDDFGDPFCVGYPEIGDEEHENLQMFEIMLVLFGSDAVPREVRDYIYKHDRLFIWNDEYNAEKHFFPKFKLTKKFPDEYVGWRLLDKEGFEASGLPCNMVILEPAHRYRIEHRIAKVDIDKIEES